MILTIPVLITVFYFFYSYLYLIFIPILYYGINVILQLYILQNIKIKLQNNIKYYEILLNIKNINFKHHKIMKYYAL